jgi:hypothetical protein
MKPVDVYHLWVNATERSAQHGVQEHHLLLAGVHLTIRLHHQNLARPMLSAICHLVLPKAVVDDDYVIDVWDIGNSGVEFPRFHHGIDDVMNRGEVPSYSGDGIDFAYFSHARMVHILNQNTKHGIVALVSLDALPSFELACPLRGIFSWILRNNDMAMIHSAAVADEEGNAHLIIGDSGAGKSTTAISCLLSGMRYIGDDLCALGKRNGVIHVFSIYSSGKTCQSDWAFMPELGELAVPDSMRSDDYHKEIYFFGQADNLSANVCLSGLLRTIFVPYKTNTDPQVNHVSMDHRESIASLLNLVIKTTRELLPDGGFESLGLLSQAFRQARVVPLRLTIDRQCPVPAVIADQSSYGDVI